MANYFTLLLGFVIVLTAVFYFAEPTADIVAAAGTTTMFFRFFKKMGSK